MFNAFGRVQAFVSSASVLLEFARSAGGVATESMVDLIDDPYASEEHDTFFGNLVFVRDLGAVRDPVAAGIS